MAVRSESISGSARPFFLLFFVALCIDAFTADNAPFAQVAFWNLLTSGLYMGLGGLAWRMAREHEKRLMKGVAVLLWSGSVFTLLSLWFLWQAELIRRT